MTGNPALSSETAMPVPIVPAPITPVDFTGNPLVLLALAPHGNCHYIFKKKNF
jgi:hypothetical protein